MIRSILTAVTFLFVLLGLVVAQEQQEDCFYYCGPRPNATAVVAVCFPSNVKGCGNCRFFDNLCPKVEETATKVTGGALQCLVGPEFTCAFNKKAHKLGETFEAFDKANECTCMADGHVQCSNTMPIDRAAICEQNV